MATQLHYGHFTGTDPRTFSPDYELCTEQEIQNWKEDCAAWDRGENPPAPPAGFWTKDENGNDMHVLSPRYGVGTYEIEDEDDEEDQIRGGLQECPICGCDMLRSNVWPHDRWICSMCDNIEDD